MTFISAMLFALLGCGSMYPAGIYIFFPAGKCILGGECERGGKQRTLPRKQVKGALPPWRDEEFLPMSEIVLGKQKKRLFG